MNERAQDSYRHALAVARQQRAKFWELRAALDLARLWRDQGKCTEAHDLLAPIYDWFTEGFDTFDLKEAKALRLTFGIGRHRPYCRRLLCLWIE